MSSRPSPTSDRRPLVWLASYPRSGSTWLRVLLARFLDNSTDLKPIADVLTAMHNVTAFRSEAFEEFTAIESSDLTFEEIDTLMPGTYRSWASLASERLYCTTYNRFRTTRAGESLFPPDVTFASVYMVRNPLDVAVSWKFYAEKSTFDESIEVLSDSAFAMRYPKFGLPEQIGAWSRHVESWRNAPFPVLVVRYEDLLADTATTLADIVRFLGLDCGDADRLRRTVQHSSFNVMKKQEQEVPWGRLATAPHLRAGRAGDWRKHLSPGQAKEVLTAHGPTMAACGYRPEDLLREISS